MYDIIIVGAGPAGLTAALYALRDGKKVLLIEKESFGGQITYSPRVENYPGILQMSGNEFADKLLEQVMALGAECEFAAVLGIARGDDCRIVETDSGSFMAKAVIIATGSRHRRLGLENEDSLVGEGVSYCAVCDGAFYKYKDVAVIGGGNTALQETVLLSDYCRSVTVIQNLGFLTGEARLVEAVTAKSNVRVILGKTVAALKGKDKLEAVVIRDAQGGNEEETTIPADGVFVAIGQVPENKPFEKVAPLDEYGYIISGETCVTPDPAVFAAGDCRTKRIRQITTATADGAVAALSACRYIDGI